jgi:hypothetical protein
MEFNERTFVKKTTRPVPCPRCQEADLEIHEVFLAIPVDISVALTECQDLSGQTEIKCEHALFLYCTSCKAKARGAISSDGQSLIVNLGEMWP